ncbi:MAG: sulfatase-like hydrolase/transferase [Caldilineales bacterium]|nr:sulfatase-like hydrolase/transferase [Caldilineales bacterium]
MLKRTLALSLFIILILRQLVWTASASAQARAAINDKPNVLIIMIDDMAALRDVYGEQAITPNMDRLFAESMVFEDAHITAPVCNPSRISILTGLRPSSTGITSLAAEHVDWRTYMSDPNGLAYQNYGPGIGQIKTLYQHFRENGYWLGGAGKTFHSYEQLIAEPWDKLAIWKFWPGIGWPQRMPLHGMPEYLAQASTVDADWGAIDGEVNAKTGLVYTEEDLPDHIILNDGLDLLASAPTDKPFMISVGFMLPHLPWYVPQRMLDLYPLDQIDLPETRADDLADIPPEGVELVWQGGKYSDQQYIFDDDYQWRKAVAHYLASVSYVDEQIGKLLTALDDQGIADNTIVVLWSDHGYHIGEKAHLQKLTLWDVSTRVSFAIKVPGLTIPDSSTDALVSAVDLFPTLVELAGLDMPTDFPRDGRSLVPLLANPQAYWPWPAMTTLGRWGWSLTDRASLRTRGWSYIRYDLPNTGPNRQEELYMRTTDPHEWRNLLSSRNGNPATYEGVRQYMELILRGQVKPDKPPTASAKTLSVSANLNTLISLKGSDPNADFLTFKITSMPVNGRLFQSTSAGNRGAPILQTGASVNTTPGWTAYVVYEPDGTATTDSFTFEVSDGRNSDTGTISIHMRHDTMTTPMVPFIISTSMAR